MSTLVPDENSMKDPLCNSSFGSMVSLDYVTPDTLARSVTSGPKHVTRFLRLQTMLLLQVICTSPRRHQEVYSVYFGIPHFGSDFWDVQEAISSVPQKCRIGNPVA